MIGTWHVMPLDREPLDREPLDREPLVKVSLGARVGGHQLVVHRCGGEDCWRWAVLSNLGHEIEGGTAPDAHAAERMAEEAAFHIHPPSMGDWVARLI